MGVKAGVPVQRRNFKVSVVRSGEDVYTAQIAAIGDAPTVATDARLGSGIMDLVGDLLLEIVREGEEEPSDGHD